MLRKPNKFNQSDFSSFFIENIRLLVTILIGFVLTVIIKFTLLKLSKRRYSLFNLLSIYGYRLGSISKLGSISLAFSFFLFFNLNILRNMIKTQKITVDTSEFIDSISKLNTTTKTLITADKESMVFSIDYSRKENKMMVKG